MRNFSTSRISHLRSSELTPDFLKSLRCKPDRLWDDIHTTAKYGKGRIYGDGPEQTGLSRLALSDSDKQARDWFVASAEELDCKVTVDSIGNIFAVRKGLNNDVPATFVGSHLDSQPFGGRFDGVLGIMAGIEMLRVLQENWIETEGPVGVVNWTNEEGARFPVSMQGSGEWAGRGKDNDRVLEINSDNTNAQTVGDELDRIGYRGLTPARHSDGGMKMAGHFELHIEQGPILENDGKSIGVVTGSQAYKWFECTVYGKAAHSGTTPMPQRVDALRTATMWINRIFRNVNGRINVGTFSVRPGSINTVPEQVTFTVDIRSPSEELLQQSVKYFEETLTSLQKSNAIKARLQMKEIFDSPAAIFDKVAMGCVETSAKELFGEEQTQEIQSGAGHDSVNTSRIVPTAMVFVPCKDGLSHHPEEWCSKQDCANGTDVIIQSVLRFDQHRFKAGM